MKTPGHAKRKHSEFSPSSAARWMNCPGSVRLSRDAPPQGESRYAKEGTDAHECLEFIVKRYKDVATAKVEAERKWPKEMVEHAVDSARRIFVDLRPSKNATLMVEKRVTLSSVSHRIYGTLEYSWVDLWGWLVVADYKYGTTPVLPVGDDGKPNPQLMIYAHGVAEAHDWDFEGVRLAIIQPRVWQNGDDPVCYAEISVKQLRAFGKELDAAVKAANRPDAPLVPGEHCKYCPALATCPANSTKALEAANVVFDTDTGIQAAPSPMLLTPKTLPKVLDACRQLKDWIAAVEEHAHRLAEDGEKIAGYKLVAKRSQRVWLPEAEEKISKAFGAGVYDVEPQFLSPAKFEKKFGAGAKGFTKKYTASVSSGFNLVPDSDKRSEVNSVLSFDHE